MVTPEEIAQAMAVHSVDDRTRSSGDADETEMVMTGDGTLQPAEDTSEPESDISDPTDSDLAEVEKKPAQIDE